MYEMRAFSKVVTLQKFKDLFILSYPSPKSATPRSLFRVYLHVHVGYLLAYNYNYRPARAHLRTTSQQ